VNIFDVAMVLPDFVIVEVTGSISVFGQFLFSFYYYFIFYL